MNMVRRRTHQRHSGGRAFGRDIFGAIVFTSIASVSLVSQAEARDDEWYVEMDAGAVKAEDVRNLTGSEGQGILGTRVGYDFGGIVGYDFGAFRLEAEASRRHVDANRSAGTIQKFGNRQVDGGVSATSFMANGLVEVGRDGGLQAFAGGGLGMGRAHLLLSAPEAALNVSDTDSGFAWQGVAGVRLPVGSHVDVGLKYRYYNQSHIDLVNQAGDNVRSRLQTHSLLATLAYNFGGKSKPVTEAPSLPPPPSSAHLPPTPPSRAEVPACIHGPYIVFFDWDQAVLTPEARAVLDSAVSAYRNCGVVPIMLAGHADRSGSSQYNARLSAERNLAVETYLLSRGIAPESVHTNAFGEDRRRVETADGIREVQNRRVEITFGPGSGR